MGLDGVLQAGQGSGWLSMLFALWVKSIIILATAALLTHMLRAASARLRHILWCTALFSLLVLPLFSGGFQPLRIPILPSRFVSNEISVQQPAHGTRSKSSQKSSATFPLDSGLRSEQNSGSTIRSVDKQPPQPGVSWQSIILLVWLAGVLFVLIRLLAGTVAVRRVVARSIEFTGPVWSELSSGLSKELQLKRPVKLLRSDESLMPMTCLGLSPVVLLPKEAERWSADRRRVVVLHELIHVKRGDLLTQMIAQVVRALYWFNPLVWLAVRRLRTEQEWACDEHVVATGIGPPEYAAHLLEIGRKFGADRMSAVSTTAMARSSRLQERLCAILKPGYERYGSGRMIAGSVVVLASVFISTAVTQLVPAQRENGTEVSTVANVAVGVKREQKEKYLTVHEAVTTDATVAENDKALEQAPSPTPISQPAASSNDLPAAQETADSKTEEQDFDNFSAEERDRLINNGIGPAYIKEMADAGYRGLTVAQLIQLFSNQVHADYVVGLRSVGYADLPPGDLLSLKTNGITPNVIRSYKGVSRVTFKARHYPAMLSNGVTPSYLRSLGDAGYDSLTANEVIALRLAGVTSDFIREVRSRGYANLSPQEMIELKRSGKP